MYIMQKRIEVIRMHVYIYIYVYTPWLKAFFAQTNLVTICVTPCLIPMLMAFASESDAEADLAEGGCEEPPESPTAHLVERHEESDDGVEMDPEVERRWRWSGAALEDYAFLQAYADQVVDSYGVSMAGSYLPKRKRRRTAGAEAPDDVPVLTVGSPWFSPRGRLLLEWPEGATSCALEVAWDDSQWKWVGTLVRRQDHVAEVAEYAAITALQKRRRMHLYQCHKGTGAPVPDDAVPILAVGERGWWIFPEVGGAKAGDVIEFFPEGANTGERASCNIQKQPPQAAAGSDEVSDDAPAPKAKAKAKAKTATQQEKRDGRWLCR